MIIVLIVFTTTVFVGLGLVSHPFTIVTRDYNTITGFLDKEIATNSTDIDSLVVMYPVFQELLTASEKCFDRTKMAQLIWLIWICIWLAM
jgi:hypothetical protein